jgi:hypothetical protein
MAAAAVTSASAVSAVILGGMLHQLVDTGDFLEVLVAAESTPFELQVQRVRFTVLSRLRTFACPVTCSDLFSPFPCGSDARSMHLLTKFNAPDAHSMPTTTPYTANMLKVPHMVAGTRTT